LPAIKQRRAEPIIDIRVIVVDTHPATAITRRQPGYGQKRKQACPAVTG
jgi:hypothetical protein